MKALIISIVCVFMIATTCKKNNGNCHYKIQVLNNSSESIYLAYEFYLDKKCNLQGKIIEPKSTSNEHSGKHCWEDYLAKNKLEIFVIDPSLYNDPIVFYSCDSIKIKNKVLKQYSLSLDDLKKNDFTISYP